MSMSEQLDPKPAPPPAQGPAPTAPAEDASTQALSEALESGFFVVKIAMALLVLYFCCSNFFSVAQNEQAVILRFGKPGALLGPGLHAAWPYPIDEVKKMPAAQVLSAGSTVGWYYTDPRALPGADKTPPPTLNPAVDGYVLTGDGNILHVKATLRYRVVDPVRFHFGFTNAFEQVTNDLDNALFYASARFTVDAALRRNLAGLTEKVQARVDALAREQDLGVAILQVDLQTAAPRQVKEAFDQVYGAENDMSTKVNGAQGGANEMLAKAKGEAIALKNAAETERTRLINEVKGEAQFFANVLPSYNNDPGLFLRRMQIETMARVMTNAQDKFFLPARADGRTRELRLQLNREPQKPKATIEAPNTGHDH
jgi:membrane protease subunit HflK